MSDIEQADRPDRFSAVHRLVGGVRVVTVQGEIDHDVKQLLSAALLSGYGAEPPSRIVVDLGGVTFMDSSGINVFVATHQASPATRGGCVSLPRRRPSCTSCAWSAPTRSSPATPLSSRPSRPDRPTAAGTRGIVLTRVALHGLAQLTLYRLRQGLPQHPVDHHLGDRVQYWRPGVAHASLPGTRTKDDSPHRLNAATPAGASRAGTDPLRRYPARALRIAGTTALSDEYTY
ncbi:STAS domain-containing protein [Streptomyces sp. NPDC059755]|uniref:STAS domain-containing protein n=1 Tax=Streptomyces sp. NPDC059755 TaxID=3346934 RepID=UPI00365A1920